MTFHNIDTKGWETKTAWCVPTVISFVTGIPLIRAHSAVAFTQNINLDTVKGVHFGDAIKILYMHGFKTIPIILNYEKPPTLIKFLKNRTSYEKVNMIMLSLEDSKGFSHMVAFHYDYGVDNHVMKPTHISEFPHRTKKVTQAVLLMKQ